MKKKRISDWPVDALKIIYRPEIEWTQETKSWEQVLCRIMDKVEMVTESGCWIFTGASRNDYGRAWLGSRILVVHRVTYELLRGKIPDGLIIDHLCRVHPCANPWHMETVTYKTNLYRGQCPTILRMNSPTCSHGHEWNDVNTHHWTYDGRMGRACRACDRDRGMKKRRENALAKKSA